jgi:ketosteroid isomerase-like protein
MPQENVENLRRLLEAWDPKADLETLNRGEAIDLSLIDPEGSYEDTVLPDHVGETYHGYEGILRATEQWLEPFQSLTAELERIVGTGDVLVSVHRVEMTAQHTGIDLEGPLAYVWTFRNGKVIHLKSFSDPTEALEAAGLSE